MFPNCPELWESWLNTVHVERESTGRPRCVRSNMSQRGSNSQIENWTPNTVLSLAEREMW